MRVSAPATSGAARIGIDGRWLSHRYPGIGRYVHGLLTALRSSVRDESFVVAVADDDGHGRFDRIPLEGFDLHRAPGGGRSPGSQMSVRRLAREASLDVFHATYFPGALGIPVPRVVSIHDLVPLHFPETITPRLRRLVYRLALRRAAAGASRILTPTRAVRVQVVESLGVPPERVVAIPYAADPRLTPPSASAVAELRRRRGLPGRYLLYLGGNKPHKNLPRLLAAWASVVRRGAEGCRLVFAGPMDERFPAPTRIARELAAQEVMALGRVDEAELPALIGGAVGLVLPSLAEGFGLPLLEAMACGTAVSCSAIEPLAEVAGDAALSFDPLDVESMAGGLGRLIRDDELRAELVKRGGERVQLFSWHRTVRLTLDVYNEVARGA